MMNLSVSDNYKIKFHKHINNKHFSDIHFRSKFIDKSDFNSKKNNLGQNIALVVSGLSGLFVIDLFLTKGKLLSTLTKKKLNFIKEMSDDIDNIVRGDSYATKNRLEAFLSVPGLHAIWGHRIVHKLHKLNIPVLPRLLSNIFRFFTGIEIHPGAKLGKNIFIDHTGAIIGETAEIGNNVTLIGRVVLGSTGKGGYLRHTIVQDNAVLGMNSTMLGRIKIGKGSKIGAGTLLTHDVPERVTVIGNPAKIIAINEKRIESPIVLNQNSINHIKKIISNNGENK